MNVLAEADLDCCACGRCPSYIRNDTSPPGVPGQLFATAGGMPSQLSFLTAVASPTSKMGEIAAEISLSECRGAMGHPGSACCRSSCAFDIRPARPLPQAVCPRVGGTGAAAGTALNGQSGPAGASGPLAIAYAHAVRARASGSCRRTETKQETSTMRSWMARPSKRHRRCVRGWPTAGCAKAAASDCVMRAVNESTPTGKS